MDSIISVLRTHPRFLHACINTYLYHTDIFFNFPKVPIGIYHYLGSWESYSYRDDARDGYIRSSEKWETLAKLKEGGSDDYVRYWIQGFVKLVGEETAKVLLQDAGLPRNYKKPLNTTIKSNLETQL